MAAPIPKSERKYTSRYLSDVRSRKIVVVCVYCPMRRRYDAAKMLERIDEDVPMPTLVRMLAVAEGCKRGQDPSFENPCGLRYDLAAMAETQKGPATQ